MKILEADLSLKEQINRFYVAQGYHSDWSETERAFVCLDDGAVVGSVKIEQIYEVAILRGMYVDDKYQRQGIGTQLLSYIEPVLNERPAFCIPLSHAADFYRKIGFREVPESTYPKFLAERCDKYRKAGYMIKTMHRDQFL
ncbi:GNAT family N-acetyltransferase [Photobacterium alginatilyticum]|uniref:N-acetyltransferase n=1 Tax=Photobacterium alginatilyticum TaxID=1775171 RepID=A0ABW9YRH6_9GAMM|nr:GNAT family N-acetyltransferase [Photobacterium alginatilyticum]NBI56096.1 N-acetyltransferase [Photobacterium alginatilyticum]